MGLCDSGLAEVADGFLLCRMGSKSPGNNTQPPAFFSKLTESNSAMVKSKKQEIIKKLSTTNKNETEYSKDMWGAYVGALGGSFEDTLNKGDLGTGAAALQAGSSQNHPMLFWAVQVPNAF